MNLDSVPLLLIKIKYGSNRSYLFPLSLIKFRYEKKKNYKITIERVRFASKIIFILSNVFASLRK